MVPYQFLPVYRAVYGGTNLHKKRGGKSHIVTDPCFIQKVAWSLENKVKFVELRCVFDISRQSMTECGSQYQINGGQSSATSH